ncbi:MAG: hypothetical protein ACKPKO_17340, partial [Candidatus Fonsibacter sp.]
VHIAPRAQLILSGNSAHVTEASQQVVQHWLHLRIRVDPLFGHLHWHMHVVWEEQAYDIAGSGDSCSQSGVVCLHYHDCDAPRCLSA